jgi:ABC-type branched-subunit amino acid transport system ATPase component
MHKSQEKSYPYGILLDKCLLIHYKGRALEAWERDYVLENGRIVLAGSSSELTE